MKRVIFKYQNLHSMFYFYSIQLDVNQMNLLVFLTKAVSQSLENVTVSSSVQTDLMNWQIVVSKVRKSK